MIADTAARRFPPAALTLVGAVGVLAVTVVLQVSSEFLALAVLLVAALAAGHRVLLRWETLLAAITLLVFFIPIKRYTLPASLPVELEPYRVLVAVVVVCWGLSLVIDQRVQLRRTAFDGPLLLIVVALLASDLANPARVDQYGSYVAKGFTFFLSFVLVYYFAANAIQTRRALDLMLGLLVVGGALVAIASVWERRTGYNIFFQIGDAIPFLQFSGGALLERGGRLRVFGSSQHPIALGAMFALLMPVAVALAHRASRWWWVATVALFLGVMASASRTPIIMLVASGAILVWLRRAEMKRLWPVVLPSIVVVHFILPGAIGTFRDAFFPAGGLIAEQSNIEEGQDPLLAGGRIRLIRPMIDEWSRKPLLGTGYGTRIAGFTEPERNSPILDDQWLGSLVEIGALGFVAWLWLFVRASRRLTRAARESRDDGEIWLFAGLGAAMGSFAIGMLTFDAFSFIQVTLIFWILLGLSAVALRMREEPVDLRAADGLPDPAR